MTAVAAAAGGNRAPLKPANRWQQECGDEHGDDGRQHDDAEEGQQEEHDSYGGYDDQQAPSDRRARAQPAGHRRVSSGSADR